jgi:hypothetical protein
MPSAESIPSSNDSSPPDDNGDDNDDNQRHTIASNNHRQPLVAAHRASVTVGYGSEGWGFESLRLRPGQRPLVILRF